MNISVHMNKRTHLQLNTHSVFICNDVHVTYLQKNPQKNQHTTKQTRNDIAVIFLPLHQPEHELYTKIEIDRKIDQTHLRGCAEFLALSKAEDTHIVHLLVSYLTCETQPQANLPYRRLFSLCPLTVYCKCFFWCFFFMLKSKKKKRKKQRNDYVITPPKFPHVPELDSNPITGKIIHKVANIY